MADQREREVIAEIINLYKSMPCLWDPTCESFKDLLKKKKSWAIITEKLKEIDPNANEISSKKKIDHLKTSYQREAKKVKESKKRCEVHRPSLWYFELLRFIDKRNEVRRNSGVSLMSEDEDEPLIRGTKRKKEGILDKKKEKLTDEDQVKQRKKSTNTFVLYVGEKLDEIPPGQRDIAEKLISDVIFLARTNNLTFNSRVETPSISKNRAHQYHQSPYYLHSPPSTHISQSPHSSPDNSSNRHQSPCVFQSHQYRPSYSPQTAPSPTLSSHTGVKSPSPSHLISISEDTECPSGEILKGMLIVKTEK